jgi:diacylglycerol kinase (CTP)
MIFLLTFKDSPVILSDLFKSDPPLRSLRGKVPGIPVQVTDGDSRAHHEDEPNGFLSPASADPSSGFGSAYWRSLSRSPSPFGLIPIHREFRAFVHKHEIPRKILHVSIGFVTLYLYHLGVQKDAIHPVLLTLLIPILSADLLRFRYAGFNEVYIRYLGAFMRESEAHDRYNGVISYLAGLWFTFRFCDKDIAVMSVLLLSWCDTAASTFGRLWGRYTPRIRRGKSLAGSLACCVFGIGTAILFWGVVAPRYNGRVFGGNDPDFAYQGRLTLPVRVRNVVGWSEQQGTIDGSLAMAVLALASGVIASASELVDIWGLDDNLLIPFFSGLGLGAFLWLFGGT